MPEYSSTTITPADSVKVPAQNGSTSGNFQLSALMSYILASKGQANGLAGLGADGKLDSSQIPANLDDVLVYATRSNFPATGEAGKIYISASNPENRMYRWDPDLSTPAYVELVPDLSVYATKAELAAEESAREAADTNLKNAINQHEARIENLEQKAGDYSTVQYRGTNAVPTGKAKYALVETIVGKTRAWNQLLNKSLFVTQTVNDVTFTMNADGSVTVNGTASADATITFYTGNNFIVRNKKYLFAGCPSGGSMSTYYQRAYYAGMYYGYDTGSGVICDMTGAAEGNANVWGITVKAGTACNNIVFKPIVRDLTTIFPEGVPATIAECVQKCPDILKYDAYGTSMVDTTVEGVKAVGVNIWDEEWEVGDYNASNGEKVPSASLMRCKNRIPIIPSETYYIKCPNVSYTYYYDADGNYINGGVSHTANSSFSVPSNAYYMTFNTNSAYGTTYKHNVQICLNSYADKTAYHPYMTDTLSLPSSVTLRSAGSVAEEYDLESGEKTNPISSVYKCSEVGFVHATSGSNHYYYTTNFRTANIKKPQTSYNVGEITCSSAIPVSASSIVGSSGGIAIDTDGTMYWSPPAATVDTAPFGEFQFALATPNPNSQATDPVLDPFIQVEGGGTISTMQTQTPVIDNCLDVGYLAL